MPHTPADGSRRRSSSRGRRRRADSPGRLLVRGSVRLEGVDFSKYDALRRESEKGRRQFTSAIRQDLIAAAAGDVEGIRQRNVMLRVSPGPLRSAVVAHGTPPRQRSYGAGRAQPSSLMGAEWDVDVEYIVSCPDAESQRRVTAALYDASATGELYVPRTARACALLMGAPASSVRALPTRASAHSPRSPSWSTDDERRAPPAHPPLGVTHKMPPTPAEHSPYGAVHKSPPSPGLEQRTSVNRGTPQAPWTPQAPSWTPQAPSWGTSYAPTPPVPSSQRVCEDHMTHV
eukprot:Hpha_TRINITY_DN1660_c0_g1::TRINITY_DN1660_c0_g1_i1::g.48688::m.48688